MIRVPAHGRSLVRIAALCSIAGAVLASCSTTPTVTPRVTGQPAISISVPLSVVGCTTDNSCVTVGTSNLGVSPVSVGEYRSSKGRWAALATPLVDSSTYIATSSCWSNGCLFAGSQSNSDLVWRYDATAHSISVERGPTGATAIVAVSCFTSMTCAILDETPNGPRFLTTDDGGSTWSAPVTFGVGSQDTVTSLSCSTNLDCMASIINASNGIEVYVSSDGGATWTVRTGFSTITWAALTSLTCTGKKCVGLAKLASGWRLVRTNNLGKSWSKAVSLPGSPYGLACTTLVRCVVVGLRGSSAPWLALVRSGTLHAVKLQYVPTAISNVACGSDVCAAIGVTTVIALRP